MSGDVERVTFRSDLLFANVELQQGRLLLPADFNEQSAIHHYFLRRLIVDLVGGAWRAGAGFTISVEASAQLNIQIATGRYYVDGIMCENEADRPFSGQPFGPTPDNPANVTDTEVALYLDCWERHVTWLNYPSLRDPALGGADTATRIQIAWQVRLLSKSTVREQISEITSALKIRLDALDLVADAVARNALQQTINDLQTGADDFMADFNCVNAAKVVDALDKARPRMVADARQNAENLDPCAIAADLEYRGRENQLYRVEIHRPGLAGQATFKWSRENASVVFKVIDIDPDAQGKVTRVTLESLGHDRRTGLCEYDWVELCDDDSEFRWQALPLLQVTKIDVQRRLVTLNGDMAQANLNRHARLRRWDHEAEEKGEGAVIVTESKDDTGWIDLERGVRIRFVPGGLYRKGDCWQFPARSATGDIEWPTEGKTRLPQEPHGITHHRAVLATLKKEPEGWGVLQCGCRRDPLCGA
jgi:uncharacterized protein DUF6519